MNFFFGSKLTKMDQKCKKCQNSLKSEFVPLFCPFLQTFAIISKTVHYLFLKFCRNLRHNKGLGMECSFWPYNYLLVQNRPKSAFLGPIFEICQIFPNFFFKFWIFFFVENLTKLKNWAHKCWFWPILEQKIIVWSKWPLHTQALIVP